ncbi:phosphoenolpyruvate--protein phosphotransferase [Pseudonocardia xishanensis]|uniref:Phosphocarrier protein HPr n=1 Tax=Pseudonocardia xishanensis TaxID=630995 RepID=A0ABP8S3Q5_9PSEU
MSDGVVGVVVVSHSRALGEAAAGLAREMVPGDEVRIEVAAGLDEHTLGTDATAIAEALTRADSGAGVVVLMDLGSAVLSAELALEFVDDPSGVLLCSAPLVEGLVAAVVAAAGGADRATVAAEAEQGAAAKRAQLGEAPPAAVPPTEASSAADDDQRLGTEDRTERGGALPDDDQEVGRFVVTPPHGLHARPAALLARTAAGFDAAVDLLDLTNGRGPVTAASLTRVASLGAGVGHEVEVRARGAQAREAVAALLDLARRGFGEAPSGDPLVGSTTVAERPPPAPTVDHGPVGGAPGIAIGRARILRAVALVVPDVPAGSVAEEHRLLDEALATAQASISATRDATPGPEAAIFDAHLAILADPALLDPARAAIAAGRSAAVGWSTAVDRAAAELASLSSDYLRARAADVRAVGDDVLRALLTHPGSAPGPTVDAPRTTGDADVRHARQDRGTRASEVGDSRGVWVAEELTPAEAATIDAAGVVVAGGSPTSHAAIILRARGIPAVVGAGEAVLGVAENTVVALDGETGELSIDPDPATLDRFRRRRTATAEREDRARSRLHEPAITPDGVRVLVGVNLGAEPDPAPGADLAGLVRTEFLFLDRAQAPDVDEQVAAYRAVADALGNRRIVLRTLDVGGDKPLPYLPRPAEQNPFLGVRGLRLALRTPGLLDEQLRAIVRTARDTPVSVMFPMVTVPAELHAAREALAAAQRAEGPAELEVGIMIEVPAAALTADRFAPDVDFFSIGTNDLTQYVTAVERGNPQLSALADPLHPAVLELIARVAGTGVPTAVCGELAADPRATGLLVGLGVRELSVSPPAVARVKQAVRESRGLPPNLWTTPDAEAVRALLPDA